MGGGNAPILDFALSFTKRTGQITATLNINTRGVAPSSCTKRLVFSRASSFSGASSRVISSGEETSVQASAVLPKQVRAGKKDPNSVYVRMHYECPTVTYRTPTKRIAITKTSSKRAPALKAWVSKAARASYSVSATSP